MADQKAAITYILSNEDAKLTGKVVPDAGGLARFGINSRFHKDLEEIGFFDEDKVNQQDALQLAQKAYAEEYAHPLQLDLVHDQHVANKMLDMAVNMGVHEAVKLTQRALTLCKFAVDETNTMNERTVEGINSAAPGVLLTMLRNVCLDFYRHLAAVRNVPMADFKSWIARANRLGV